MRNTRKRILSAALLLPVVLFSAVWTSFALWRCGYDGIARTECCCPKKPEQPSASSAAAAVLTGACCQMEQHEIDRAPAEAARNSGAHMAAVAGATVAAIPAGFLPAFEPPLLRSVSVWLEDDGPPRGRTLVAQKQALLI